MIKVSVICMTYNQEKLIRRALDGFVMQKTNFPFEVIVHDDASTDTTPDIIREYQQKYPDIIKPIFRKTNAFSQGINVGYSDEFLSQIHGQYIALCEGDDYWIDADKLQIQADFLDSHPDFAICFHPVKVIWENNKHKTTVFPSPKSRFYKTVLTLDDLLKRNFIQTNSVMYRELAKPHRDYGNLLPGDWFSHMLHAKHGKIGFINKVMGVYFRNSHGIWSNQNTDDFYIRNGLAHLRFFDAVEQEFNVDRNTDKQLMCKATAEAALRSGNIELINKLFEQYGSFLQMSFADTNKADEPKLHRKLKSYRFATIILSFVSIILLLLLALPK